MNSQTINGNRSSRTCRTKRKPDAHQPQPVKSSMAFCGFCEREPHGGTYRSGTGRGRPSMDASISGVSRGFGSGYFGEFNALRIATTNWIGRFTTWMAASSGFISTRLVDRKRGTPPHRALTGRVINQNPCASRGAGQTHDVCADRGTTP